MLASRDKTLEVNGMDVNGDTALHLGAHRGNLMITLLLLQRGANVNASNRKAGCKAFILIGWRKISVKKNRVGRCQRMRNVQELVIFNQSK